MLNVIEEGINGGESTFMDNPRPCDSCGYITQDDSEGTPGYFLCDYCIEEKGDSK